MRKSPPASDTKSSASWPLCPSSSVVPARIVPLVKAPPATATSPGSDDAARRPCSYRRARSPTRGDRAMSDQPDTLFIAAASYASVDDAVSDYEAVKMLYYEVKAS